MSRRKHVRKEKNQWQLFLERRIKKAENLSRQTGKDVVIYHDERDRVSLCSVNNAKRMHTPKYVLATVYNRDVQKKLEAKRQAKRSMVGGSY